MQVVVDSLLTTYNRSGKGKTIVLIHGWGDSAASFRGLKNQLVSAFDVINLNLPGFGQTQAPSSVWGLDEYAEFVGEFLKKIEVKTVHAFIGHSNGGALLIRGLGTGTLKASKLILLASSGVRTNDGSKRAAFKVIAKVGKATTFFLPEKHKKQLRKKLYGVAGSDMLVVPELQETFKKTVRQDVQQDAAQITVPTLLIYGSDDNATTVADGRQLHKLIKSSDFKVIDGATHYLHQEKPDIVLSYIKDFLK